MPKPSDWGLEQTRKLKLLVGKEAETLMDEYELPPSTREALQPFIGINWIASKEDQPSPNPVSQALTTALLAPPSLPSKWQPPDPDRPQWFAIAWLLGGSYTVIARLHGISPQAVQASVNRKLEVNERHTHRIGYRESLDYITQAHDFFYSNLPLMRSMDAFEASRYIKRQLEAEADE